MWYVFLQIGHPGRDVQNEHILLDQSDSRNAVDAITRRHPFALLPLC